MQDFTKIRIEPPQRIADLIKEFHDNNATTVPISIDKKPLTSWKTKDRTGLNLDIDWPEMFGLANLGRVALAFNDTIEEKIMVVDIDTADSNALILVEHILTEYNNKIIAYPTRKGAHLWFKIPKIFEHGSWWTGRKVGYVSKSGIGPIDYLNGGLINVGLKSIATGQMELLVDTDKFGVGEINQPMKAIFDRVGFNTLDLNWNSLNELPELDYLLYPLKKPGSDQTIEDIKFKTSAGMNTNSFTSWAGQLNMKTQLDDDAFTDMEDILEWMNDNLTGDAWFEDLDNVINSQRGYENEFCAEPYRVSKRAEANRNRERQKKERENLIKERNETLSEKVNVNTVSDAEWERYDELKDSMTIQIAEFLIKALDVRLLNDNTLVLRKGEKDIINPQYIQGMILQTRPWSTLDVTKAKKIVDTMKSLLISKINVEGETDYIATYVKKPLWVDKNGKVIDPFDMYIPGTNNFRILTRAEAGIDRDVVPFHLNIDFDKLGEYDKKSYDLFTKWIKNAVGNDIEKFKYVFKYYGYTFMIGDKFTRQIGLVGGVTQSGKTTLEEILAFNIIGKGNTGIANTSLFDGRFGLQPIAGKSRAVLDEGASAFDKNSEHIKRISGTETTLVEPKGSAAYEAFIPKITVLFNDIPDQIDYADPAVMNRLTPIFFEKPLPKEFNNETKNHLLKYGGEAFFLLVVSSFKDAVRADITTAENSEFWLSPFQYILEEHVRENEILKYALLADVIRRGLLVVKDNTTSEIKEQIATMVNDYETIQFKNWIQENRNNLPNGLKALGYTTKRSSDRRTWQGELYV